MSNEEITEPQEAEPKAATASYSQWSLIWRRFKKHKAGLIGGYIVVALYVAVFLGEFLAPHGVSNRYYKVVHCPPQRIHFISDEGLHLRPFVYGIKGSLDRNTGIKQYTEDSSKRHPIYLFSRGDEYEFYGLFKSDLHLFGTGKGNPIFLLGTDRFGRDMLSRIIVGGRISLTIGLFAVTLSLTLGSIFGVISGFYGGTIDNVIQRMIELIFAFPSIPILMALSAVPN